jgi:hypothetical protein
MRTKYPLEIQSRLEEVSAVFARWRSTRKPRSRIPEELWQAAIDLAPCCSTHHIARALRLNYTELKHRIKKHLPKERTAEFLEIDMRQLLPTAPCVLELRSPSGFELKIHNFDRIQSQLPPLINCFLGQRP